MTTEINQPASARPKRRPDISSIFVYVLVFGALVAEVALIASLS